MSACLLIDSFQLYLEMSVAFGLFIYQPLQTADLLGMKMFCCKFFLGGRGDSNKKAVL